MIEKFKEKFKDTWYITWPLWIVITLLLLVVIYALFGWFKVATEPKTTSTGSTLSWVISSNIAFWTGNQVTFSYTWRVQNGDVFEASEKPVTISYKDTEVPLKLRDSMIGMKKGESKKVVLSPVEWFWEKTLEKVLPIEAFTEKVEQTLPLDFFEDSVIRNIPYDNATGATVGSKIDLWNGVFGEVISASGAIVTVKISNPTHPFKGKKVEVGATDSYGSGGTIKVISISNGAAKVEMDNVLNPFWKRKMEIGSKAPMLNGSGSVEVVNMTTKDVTLRYDNLHPLAGKTTEFDIYINDVK